MSFPILRLTKFLLASLVSLVVGGCGYSDELHERHALVKLLWEERYADLDKAFTRAEKERESGKLSSNQLRTRIWQLQSVDLAFKPRFDAWVARQGSSHAYLVRGWFRLEQARKLRGDGPASQISPERFARVHELAQMGADDMDQALAKDSRCAMCIGGQIIANLNLGRRDDDLVEKAFLIDPTLWQPVAAHFISLYPQWGGSEEEMSAFIDHMGTLKGTDQTVRRLKAKFHFCRGLMLQFNYRDNAEAIKSYETAISYFADAEALKNVAAIYSTQGMYDKAAEALERNLHENDEWDLYTIEALAQAYFGQGKRRDGEKMMKKRDELMRRFRNGE